MSFSSELSLLLACVRREPDGRALRALAASIDPARFVELARWHGVAPLVAHALDRADLEDAGVVARTELLKDFRHNTLHAARLSMELLRVIRLLEGRGIPSAPFKGAAIAASAYGNVWLRQFSDIDLLVPPEHAVEARRALEESGYRPTQPMTPRQEAEHVRASPFAYSFSLVREGGHMAIDLHWRLSECGHPAFPRRLSEPWGRLVERRLGEARVRTFDPEDTLLLLSAHAAKHGWERLRWIGDIAWHAEARPAPDWTAALATAVESGPIAERTLLVSLALVERLLGTALPAAARERIARDPVTREIAAETAADLDRMSDEWPLWRPRGFRSDALFLRMAQTPGRKARYFLRFCVYRVAAPDAKDRAATALPARLSFLYYLLRPVRLLREYGLGPVRSFLALLPRLRRSA